MSIGDRIREARRTKGYTQEYVAQQLNVSRQAVSKWEKNLSCPDTGNLIGLAELLGVTVEHLAAGKNPVETAHKRSGRVFCICSLIPLGIMLLCHFVGLFSGEYTDMVSIPLSSGMRLGIPFLYYGDSPAALALMIVSGVCLMLSALLLFIGISLNKDKNEG